MWFFRLPTGASVGGVIQTNCRLSGVAVMGVTLGPSIRGDPHLLTVSHLSPLCSLYLTLSPRHGVTDPGREKTAQETESGWHILLDTGIAEILAK